VRGALKGKTTLLVTHQVDFLHNVDQILVSLFFSHAVLLRFDSRVIQKLIYVLVKGDERRHDNPIRKVQ